MLGWEGGRSANVGNVLQCGHLGGAPLRVGVIGNVPADWEGSGQLSPSVCTTTDGVDATAEQGRDMDIPSPGGGDDGGGTTEDINLCFPLPKQFRVIY